MKIKGGYILQPRIIDESETSRFPPHVREIWLYLLRKANHEDRIVHGIFIKRGQLKTSYKDILEDLSWFVGYRKESYKKHHCEIAMKMLTKQRMVATAKTTRGMIVTICNYDYYQDPKNYETDSENHNKATTKPQSNDTINKNYKNYKNYKNSSGEKSPVTLHALCKDLFHEKFRVLFGEEYYWEAKDAANLNAITKKIKRNRELKGLPTDDDKVLFAFGAFIDSIKDRWLLENFSIPNINSKFNEIISQAKQKNGQRKQQSATTDDELLESIKAGIQRGITENSIQ